MRNWEKLTIKKEDKVNGEDSGAVRRILSGEIKDKLEDVKKLSACILEQSQATHDFFLGETPTIPAKDSSPRGSAGYFCQVRNDIDDVHGFLREALDSLMALAKEIGIDRTKISERPERRF